MRGLRNCGLVVVVLLAVAATAPPVSAHGNHVSADPQLSADGTVLVESALVMSDGWLVLHADDDGEIGESIGHARLESDGGMKTDVPVPIDAEAWQRTNGSRVVHVALHRDDGDGSFEPGEDELLHSFGEPAAVRITVERSDAPAAVLVEGFTPQETDEPTATLRTIVLPSDGHVVLKNGSGDGDGAVVGARSLGAGSHDDVTVQMDGSFYRAQGETFAVTAVAYSDDGDGRFDEGDEPITAGSEPVSSTFGIEKTGGGATPTAAQDDSDTSGTTTAMETATERGPTTTESDGAGFGLGVGLVTLGVIALLARRVR